MTEEKPLSEKISDHARTQWLLKEDVAKAVERLKDKTGDLYLETPDYFAFIKLIDEIFGDLK